MAFLETDRLLLRRMDMNDAVAMVRLFGHPEVMRFGVGAQTEEWVRDWLVESLLSYEEKGYGPLAVVKKTNNDVIGYCGLFYFSDIRGRPEIELGYRFIWPVWGFGYATEAASAVRDYAFNTLGIERLISLIDPYNVASVGVAQKLGMVYEADVMLPGYTHPDHVYFIEKGIREENGSK
jgi:RimJ/RimL family protein N-acetyltransferase